MNFMLLRYLLICSLSVCYTVSSGQSSKKLTEGLPLKVMSYNIHHANPPSKDSLIDIDAIVKVIRAADADLVALQEVDQLTKRSGKMDQPKLIAEKLGMHYYFAKAMDYDDGGYGQVLLSKYPIRSTRIHRLPAVSGFKGEPRIMAEIYVQLDQHTEIRFATVHLDAQKDEQNRVLQAQYIVDNLKKKAMPSIVAGDFNATEDSAPLTTLKESLSPTCANCPFTIPVVNPKKAIDFIMLDKASNWKVVSHQVISEKYASDHLPILSTLTLNRER
ncbi:endonuclease/exonuclease/phosphatase family protein [Sphingobacterium paludis]|uniref:Endonuclease/exonuclease/phosphatase family metal-dependent hydrolase n=1 Tax=Sphingobacterium paludis TaxID=1476465 RepID=A0A4R7CUQ0_9SPHI|nr:endonuclease/exonuclease/phosphatase family protein [Sphingobacterium paludis]TDS11870.1 endonuclease/exonuclease/phosphatase family metal-dependent hydrolase [Sphingobacterium paludis]